MRVADAHWSWYARCTPIPCIRRLLERRRRYCLCLLFISCILLGSLESVPAAKLRVVTSVAPLTDMVKQVGGGAIILHGLVPEGTNAHTFRPAPGDVRYLATADLLVLNGLGLEGAIEKLARSSGRAGITILKLADRTITQAEWVFDFSFPRAQGHPNPHLWLNVAYAMTYVRLIRDRLMTLDPPHAGMYHRQAASYLARLQRLDRCIAAAIASIPPPYRVLLTYHDSWPYFARRYGMRVLGAVQPANFFAPSPGAIARIVEQIRQVGVPAIFGSAVFPSKVLAKIAAETGVQYVSTLRDDTLPGKPGEAEHSYIGMMLANVTSIVQALKGRAEVLQPCKAALLARRNDAASHP